MSSEERFEQVLKKIKEYHPDVDTDCLWRAFEYSRDMHDGQMRKSGHPFVRHPVEVVDVIAELNLDDASLAAGLLHDTVEDTESAIEDIEKRFGEDVAYLVDGVTKLSKIEFNNRKEHQAENIRKMIIAMSKDLRVILLKLADRLHNMRTLEHMPRHKQERIAQETMDIYAPLAHRLGINWVKTELEDLSFRFMYPDQYEEVKEKVTSKELESEEFIEEVINRINNLLGDNSIKPVDVYGRSKHYWSIFRKMREQQISFEQVYDVLAFRMILEEKPECYEALGLVHNRWTPIPGRFKDYIAIPKPNGYQSLHTSVMGPYQERIEIQIRTEEMHKVAEEGVAAHWMYKEGNKVPDKDKRRFSWLHRLMEEHRDHDDPREFLESVKIDLFHEEVYVLTPDGEVMEFPSGATCVDFAYAIHTEVGHTCTRAKVNGKIQPLDYTLETGDIVEIQTDPNRSPNKDWLDFVKTGKARTKIKKAVRQEQRERSKQLGRELLDKELTKRGTKLSTVEDSDEMIEAVESSRFNSLDEALTDIGYGKSDPEDFAEKLFEDEEEPTEDLEGFEDKDFDVDSDEDKQALLNEIVEEQRPDQEGIVLDGIGDIMVRYAKCCNPVPGDDVVGFVTRGRGLSVHTRKCPRIEHHDKNRQVDVRWDEDATSGQATLRPVKVRVYSADRPGLLANMSESFSDAGVNIKQAHCLTKEDKRAENTFDVLVKNVDQLNKAMKKIEQIQGVYKVERV